MRIESEVQHEHIHARFAQNPELPFGRVLLHEFVHDVYGQLTSGRDTRYLEFRRGRRDVGIEPAAG